MGKANRADKRRGERMITLPASEMQRIASQHAQAYFEKQKEKLSKQITESVNVSWCYLIAKALEDSFKWFETSDRNDPKKADLGINRIYKVLDKFILSVEDMQNDLIDIQTIGQYFNHKGLVLKFDETGKEVLDEGTNSDGLL